MSIQRVAAALKLEPDGLIRPHPAAAELPMFAPSSLEGLRQVVVAAARDRLAIVPCGLGSTLGWTRPPTHADLVLSTRNFSGVIAHEPDDGTISARAGTGMRELRERVARGGHWLTPDVARPERSTLGGVVASGRSGVDRTRLGPLRNHVLGVTALLGDGTVARSGGQLVKNVTGYDLHRLYTGSHGTLCVVLDVALRLSPAPAREAWLEHDAADVAEAFASAHRALELDARWLSLAIERRGGSWTVCGRLAGNREVVEAERELARRAWPGARSFEDAEAVARAEQARDRRPSGSSEAHLAIACRRSRAHDVARLAIAASTDRAPSATVAIDPSVAWIELAVPAEHAVALARSLRATLAPLDATVALRNAFDPADPLDPFGDRGPELALMRRIRAQLDPHGVLAAGRAFGGL